jgi:TRAP-type C4-dicarboxylate transport system permease small subunit
LIRKVWDNIEEGALCLLLFFMVTITFATVVTRYVFDLPLFYIDQLVPNMFVWVTFLGASAAVKRKAHLGLSLLYDMVPAGARAALDALILLGCGAFFLGTAVYGAKIVSMQMENRLMTSLGYPSWFVGLAVPVGSVLFVVRAVEAWWRHRQGAQETAPGTPGI